MKEKNFILTFSLAMALALAACTADSGMDIVGGEAEMPVAFSAYTSSAVTRGAGSPATRGVSVSPSDLQTQGIGVFAFYQKAKSNGYPVNFNKYTGEPTFMYNQKVAYDTLTSSWDYTPHKYWPNNTNDQISFFAYAPYDVTTAWEDLQLVTNLKGDKFTRHYIIEDDVEDQQDFLWADPIINQQKPTIASALQFNFRHLCARLSASAKVNVKATSIYVTIDTVKITGAFLSSGTIVYLPANDSLYWTDLGGSGEKTYYPFMAGYVTDTLGHSVYSPFVVDTLENYIHGDTGFMYVIPGTQDVTLTAIVSQRSSTTSFVKSYEVTKTITNMLLEGNKAYNFLLNITLTPVTFTGTVDATWSVSTTEYTSEDNGNTWN